MSPPPILVPVASLDPLPAGHDALVLVLPSPLSRTALELALPPALRAAIQATLEVDRALATGPQPPVVLAVPGAPGGRLVLAPTGTLLDETDDLRPLAEATAAAIGRAVQAGARRPLLVAAAPSEPRYARALEVAALSALGTAWAPLESREAGKAPPRAEAIGIHGLGSKEARFVEAAEAGRALSRDITGTEPERMAPPRVAEACREAFAGSRVEVTVETDVSSYPLLAAVARASQLVERHRPCVVRLTLSPDGPVTRTLFLAGKGVTYDTGGADLKTDGSMAGMSRDKGGAGVVAGLVLTLSKLELPGLRVVALLGMVRNSVGEEGFVSDEIIVARSGQRVRIGNTDAEGRLVLADLLSALRDEAKGTPSPTLVSVATLTGHVYRAFGPCVGALENGPARALGRLAALAAAGESLGEPFESTRPRREDYALVAAKTGAEDVISSNRLASVNTPRGHQGPYAFLDLASGIKGSGQPFLHLDISGVVVSPPDWQLGRPTGAPVAALAAWLAAER